jgi:hypothetical protein
VVAAGLTDCVPPVAAILKLEPSEPVSVKPVAFDVATVNMLEPPAVIDAGLAETFTVGLSDGGGVEDPLPPHPVAIITTGAKITRTSFKELQMEDSLLRTFITRFLLFY